MWCRRWSAAIRRTASTCSQSPSGLASAPCSFNSLLLIQSAMRELRSGRLVAQTLWYRRCTISPKSETLYFSIVICSINQFVVYHLSIILVDWFRSKLLNKDGSKRQCQTRCTCCKIWYTNILTLVLSYIIHLHQLVFVECRFEDIFVQWWYLVRLDATDRSFIVTRFDY